MVTSQVLQRLINYLVTAQLFAVILLIITNAQAVRVLARRSFSLAALGWFAHLVYLLIGTLGVPALPEYRWLEVSSVAFDVISAALFGAALLSERRVSSIWRIALTLLIVIAASSIWAPFQLRPFLMAMLNTFGLVALAVFYCKALTISLPGAARFVHLPAGGALCYAMLQPLSAIIPATTAAPFLQILFVVAIASKVSIAYGLEAAFIEKASIGARLSGAAATIGRVTHELGTPIAQIGLHVDRITQLLGPAEDRVAAELQALDDAVLRVNATLSAAQQLLPTPNDLIDLNDLLAPTAASDSRAPRTSVVNVNTVVQLAVMAIKETRPERAVLTVHYSHNCCVRADSVELMRAIVNLLRNAYDAVSPDRSGRVAVLTQGEGNPDGGRVIIRVIDNGEGIPPGLQQKIFEEGFSTRNGPGRGYGLAVVRTVIEGYGGSVKLQRSVSDDEAKTIATVTLPRVRCTLFAFQRRPDGTELTQGED
ncbi:MAG TPA: sensor histidine kinase [Thermoanaerobaculia bacterium]|jgi:signal transduction histidine kinase